MTHPFAPHAHKVKVREVSTGIVSEVVPVDARERVTHPKGGWEYVTEGTESTDAPAAPATVDTPPNPATTPDAGASIATRLGEKAWKDLKALAKSAGIIGNLDKDALIAALVPHVEGGTVNLDDAKGLPSILPLDQFPTLHDTAETS